eukprot:TRINITY_DN34599_c0_g1_i1.p1 TRINITY_DN34599_c0_g1~~TRINITY_DN34599_c0_g1_i1.p1  ORF type:complete len:171 (+),score=9.55 TRINITY_DN34599_c0_g1_i1:36-515(+)
MAVKSTAMYHDEWNPPSVVSSYAMPPNPTAPPPPPNMGHGPPPHSAIRVATLQYGAMITPPHAEPGGDVPGHPDLVYGYPNRPCVQKHPSYSCMYVNGDDPRVFVRGRSCGGTGCAKITPNLATRGGIACLVLSLAIPIALSVLILILAVTKSDGSGSA